MAIYASNEELLKEYYASKEKGSLTPRMGELLWLIAENFSRKPNWAMYSYREDMVSHAVVILCQNWHKFDPEKSNNPFGYYTTSVYRAFLHYLFLENILAEVKDDMREMHGLNVSFRRQEAKLFD